MKKLSITKCASVASLCAVAWSAVLAQNGAANAAQNAAGKTPQKSEKVSTSPRDSNSPIDNPAANIDTSTGHNDVPAPADSSYVIGPADVLSIRVWHEPDLSGQNLPVRPDGKISLALLNDVQAAGLTPVQLAEEVTNGLKKFVSDPQVTVVVDEINSKRIYLVGQVARPGAYPLLPQMTVLQAISSAGGFPQYANPKKTYVLRGDKKLPFNYKTALRGENLNQQIILQPGDTIVVP